jgi:hypothetical protein
MYYYIYDNYLSERKYNTTIAKIESRLTDLGINGKIIKMSILKNLEKTINDDIKNGVKTLVIVGNDKTLNQTINLLEDLNITIGFIPVGPNNNIAKLMGIPEGEIACDTLSSRIIKLINLGLINKKQYFITYLEMPGDNIYINCDNNYLIDIEDKNSIVTISNIYWGDDNNKLNIRNNIEYLNLIIKNQKKSLFTKNKEYFSNFKVKKVSVNGEKSVPIILIDEKRIIKTPIIIEIANQQLNLIVGKKRTII